MAGSLSLEETVLKFNEVDGLKFGDFVVRTGEHTPFYIDMRVIWSYPKIVVSGTSSNIYIIAGECGYQSALADTMHL